MKKTVNNPIGRWCFAVLHLQHIGRTVSFQITVLVTLTIRNAIMLSRDKGPSYQELIWPAHYF